MFRQALDVHGVPAPHEHDRLRAGAQIVGADGAVCVQTSIPTRMRVFSVDGHACTTAVTMVVIDAEPLPYTTNATAVAVVRLLSFSIVIKLTLCAKIARKKDMTAPAMTSYGLVFIATLHACHLFGCMTVNLVVLLLVVTTAASVVVSAAFCANPTLSFVMVAAGASSLARKAGVVLGFDSVLRDGTETVFGEELVDTFLLFGV